MAVLQGTTPSITIAPTQGVVILSGNTPPPIQTGLGGVISITGYGAASAAFQLPGAITVLPGSPTVTVYPDRP